MVEIKSGFQIFIFLLCFLFNVKRTDGIRFSEYREYCTPTEEHCFCFTNNPFGKAFLSLTAFCHTSYFFIVLRHYFSMSALFNHERQFWLDLTLFKHERHYFCLRRHSVTIGQVTCLRRHTFGLHQQSFGLYRHSFTMHLHFSVRRHSFMIAFGLQRHEQIE